MENRQAANLCFLSNSLFSVRSPPIHFSQILNHTFTLFIKPGFCFNWFHFGCTTCPSRTPLNHTLYIVTCVCNIINIYGRVYSMRPSATCAVRAMSMYAYRCTYFSRTRENTDVKERFCWFRVPPSIVFLYFSRQS